MNMYLVSGDLLGKPGIKSVYESGKLIMIKLCTTDNVINKVSNFSYIIEHVSLWHSRLEHIGINTMKRLIKSRLILCDVNYFEICEICVK